MLHIEDLIYLQQYYRNNEQSFLSGMGIRKRDSKTPGYQRVLSARDAGQKIIDARELMSAGRFDIAAKTMFARNYIEGGLSSWPEKVYNEHLHSWNNFYEEDPLKETYNDFKGSFIALIDSYCHDRINYSTSPVVINSVNGVLRNGAHRVAAAITTNNSINVIEETSNRQWLWSADFFRGELEEKPESILDEKYIDAMTVEYTSVSPDNLFAVIIFPAAKGHRVEARKHLETIGKVVNHKTFKHNEFNGRNIIRQLYYGEEWNYEGAEGVTNKAKWCFRGEGDLQVYIIESKFSHKRRTQEKEYLRNIWGVDKNSIHMTDTPEETNNVARMFFHEATRQTLKKYHSFSPHIQGLFDKYRKAVPENFIDKDKFCIDSSAVLDFFGIREAADIDYICQYGDSELSIDGVDEHDDEYIQYYPFSRDDMIVDPDNYFYYAGCKILTLKLVESMKNERLHRDPQSREKDIKDIKLIKKYFRAEGARISL